MGMVIRISLRTVGQSAQDTKTLTKLPVQKECNSKQFNSIQYSTFFSGAMLGKIFDCKFVFSLPSVRTCSTSQLTFCTGGAKEDIYHSLGCQHALPLINTHSIFCRALRNFLAQIEIQSFLLSFSCHSAFVVPLSFSTYLVFSFCSLFFLRGRGDWVFVAHISLLYFALHWH